MILIPAYFHDRRRPMQLSSRVAASVTTTLGEKLTLPYYDKVFIGDSHGDCSMSKETGLLVVLSVEIFVLDCFGIHHTFLYSN